ESGYLTRRLIDVGQDVIVYDEDCHTEQGILIAADEAQKMRPEDLRRRMTGRWLADRCVDEQTGDVIAERNEEITEALAATLQEALSSGRADRKSTRLNSSH